MGFSEFPIMEDSHKKEQAGAELCQAQSQLG